MNENHARLILQALASWYENNAAGPQFNCYLMGENDDMTLQEHIRAALAGVGPSFKLHVGYLEH